MSDIQVIIKDEVFDANIKQEAIKVDITSSIVSPVFSVNGEIGNVILDTDDVLEGINKYVSEEQKDKLDGIEALADVTNATSVSNAGALMEIEMQSPVNVKLIDQDLSIGSAPVLDGANFTSIPAGEVNHVSNVSTNKILGRITAGEGNSEELSPNDVRTLINVEDGSTADQTGAEIKTAYEAEANAYTDTKKF